MSQVALISAATPMPDPPPDTSTETAGSTLAYVSAHACARLTMVSEPMFWITVFLLASLFLQAVWIQQTASRTAAVQVIAVLRGDGLFMLFSPVCYCLQESRGRGPGCGCVCIDRFVRRLRSPFPVTLGRAKGLP